MQRLLAFLSSPWAFRLWIVFIVLSQSGYAGRLADDFVVWLFGPRPDPGEQFLRRLMQKGYHVMLFSVLGVLTALPPGRRTKVETLLWCIGFSGFSESLQFLSPGRHPAWMDVLLNVFSALIGNRVGRRAATRWTGSVRERAPAKRARESASRRQPLSRSKK